MAEGAVIYATHEIFWKKVFRNHAKILEEFIKIPNYNVLEGFQVIQPFYSAYSYYLKSIREEIKSTSKSMSTRYREDNRYNSIKLMFHGNYYDKLEIKDLRYFNEENNRILKELFKSFELVCHTLIKEDVMPNISTGKFSDYDRQLIFALYDSFYEHLFNTHARIVDILSEFSILNFPYAKKSIMSYYYGYSYYVGEEARVKLIKKFESLNELGNKEEILALNIILLKDLNPSKELILKVGIIKEQMLDELNETFELINDELPKSNIFPKKMDKVYEDRHLI